MKSLDQAAALSASESVMDILSEIIAAKRHGLDAAKRATPLEQLRSTALEIRANTKSHALSDTLRADAVNIIAEFKRRSPSKGTIRENADAPTIARSYQSAGAAAISVLTEENYFSGSLDDLRAVREVVSLPLLRKDFIFDEYQVYESAAAGAAALLLIVAALDDETLARLLRLTEEELRMDALVEVHTKEEMIRAIALGAKLIGVNNRDLRTFNVSIETSLELAQFAPADVVLVSESGLSPNVVAELRAAGYRGFLVGEHLMRAADPAAELRAFRGEN
ncbi:MAG TPA: indole-3-glycerol phosphate synthase TrpC [Pyrinomonadaceae bacterium]|nr:indole-3-glycerol phosphate synthase TrpC [Pyrinomonadaceae bacterium]